MKKVQKTIYRMLMAIAVGFFMFSGLKTTALAKSDEVVIDLSQGKRLVYDLTKYRVMIDDQYLRYYDDDAQKAVVMSLLITELNFGTARDPKTLQGYEDMIIDYSTDPKQYVVYTLDDNIYVAAGPDSVGTLEATFTESTLKKMGNYGDSPEYVLSMMDKFFRIVCVNENGEKYFKLKIRFNNPNAAFVKIDANGNRSVLIADKQFSENGYSYTVTGDDEVAFTGITKKSMKTVNIPSTVTHQNITYKVTSVSDKALYGNKKVKSVTIGENVITIGKSAFEKCKKLKKVKVKTTVLTSVGKKAFKKNADGFSVKVPKAQYRAYKRLFKKSGLSSNKIKK
ncbi:leucine-rich repeat protein [Butyrivibrio sp. AE3006]|uniref:leucine-rich repeat protein n=1 Tax=Butyrivibrio sp. AE3006 TaxID=1280673 RepID=UPI000415798E|nr:leucine-rich repeat protein [Butyrivibrio sp. AE3006]